MFLEITVEMRETRSGPNRPAAAIGGVIYWDVETNGDEMRLDLHLLWTNQRRKYIFGYVLLIFFCHRVLKCQEILMIW